MCMSWACMLDTLWSASSPLEGVCLGEDGSAGMLHVVMGDMQVVCGSDYEAQCREF